MKNLEISGIEENQLLKTNRGLKKIKNVNIGDIVLTLDGWRLVVDKLDTGNKYCYELKLRNGLRLVAANTNRVMAANHVGKNKMNFDWAEISKLNRKNYVLTDKLFFYKNEFLSVSKDTIASVKFIGWFQTYDIEIENGHSCICQGIAIKITQTP